MISRNHQRTQRLAWFGPVAAVGGAIVALLGACSDPAAEREKLATAAKACERFYVEERLPHSYATTAGRSWVKDGKFVVELEVRKWSDSKTYTPRLCVVDEAAGTISLPALTDQARWQK